MAKKLRMALLVAVVAVSLLGSGGVAMGATQQVRIASFNNNDAQLFLMRQYVLLCKGK